MAILWVEDKDLNYIKTYCQSEGMFIKEVSGNFLTITKQHTGFIVSTMITKDEVKIRVDLLDFIQMVFEEVGSVAWVFSSGAFKKKLGDAIINSIEKIKAEIAKVI